MERSEWLKKMRAQAETLYDHLAPAYWLNFGVIAYPEHSRFIGKFLARLAPQSAILDAGCGAGRYDGMLVEAGHTVLGVDQSSRMLARAREVFPPERFPGLEYAKIGLQEIDFHEQFDGSICVDALEHVSPEDWPGILDHLQRALKPGGALYLTLDIADWDEVGKAYEQAKAMGLPVVFGEVADRVDSTLERVAALDPQALSGEQADPAVYHFYPRPEQVRVWLDQAGLVIEEEGTGDGYEHLLARKNPGQS